MARPPTFTKEKPERKKGGRTKAKPKQTRFPDESFAGTKHPDIDKAADLYVEHRNERMAATELETESSEALITVMAKHGCQEYRIPDTNLVVKLKQGKHKVSVKTVKEDGEESDGDEEDIP